MSAAHQLSARQFALRLSALDEFERKSLLAVLPPDKQQELQQLIEEIESTNIDRSAFELVMAELETIDAGDEILWSEAQLQSSLSGESFAVKQQLTDIFVRQKKSLITPHVRNITAEYLRKRIPPLIEPIITKPWWKVWG